MPLSTFDGEPTEALHEHFDPDGNPTGYTIVTTPGWSDMDRAWALALSEREADRCPRGHDLSESLDYDIKWVPQDPLVCHACVAADAAAKAWEKDDRHRAMLHPLKKVQRPKKTKRRG